MDTIVERRRRSRLFVVLAICFALLSLSRNIHAASSNRGSKLNPMIIHQTRIVEIVRGGSLEEGSQEESEDDDSTSSSSSLTEIATALRLEGKEHHDRGDFVKAAEVFQRAADTLLSNDDDESSMRLSEDYATCRLHQALCNLKSENYELCIEACSDVLQDEDRGSGHGPAINARAYHRRAKAKLALGDNAGALQDARTASFLGDGKAVNLYGKLMRETSSSEMGSIMNNPMMPETPLASSPHSALLESLMNKSSDSSPMGGLPDFNPMSMLMGNSGDLLSSLGSGGSGMAKSVVKNLVKKLDDESTRVTISDFLQRTDTAQLRNLAGMAGVDGITDGQLAKIEKFCHGVTPKTIKRTVGLTKVAVYLFKVIRRTLELIQKYKTLIVAAMILLWTKSAILRPLPINKRAVKKAAKLAAKEALKGASKAGFF
mmetsp:Transcript_3739/g.8942  ORF Transcript_3739/g.8942 Transcript_3739/m.8942 type:complete len:431 (+) Transcript_3739:183-1475(+)|eukprot:CAMPEP_0116097450 /NCGR_PEP_ID=MMETSP0327-20121206/10713_1 /TAXON_ID=44447 /ORGANISM="Pseudo-nitzschia delicatissima, Strain B596" /LENGTH=430 /DNA_ID=CAMNT_0003589205 /DNA_START=101 /DNA_END=1393 /DNA_ORIENTATION=-